MQDYNSSSPPSLLPKWPLKKDSEMPDFSMSRACSVSRTDYPSCLARTSIKFPFKNQLTGTSSMKTSLIITSPTSQTECSVFAFSASTALLKSSIVVIYIYICLFYTGSFFHSLIKHLLGSIVCPLYPGSMISKISKILFLASRSSVLWKWITNKFIYIYKLYLYIYIKNIILYMCVCIYI